MFAQAAFLRNTYAGEARALRLRTVGFWRSHDGFGVTSSGDWDHVLGKTLLLRWGTIGTVSEVLRGLDWRSELVLYQNLERTRAMAYEVFVRGVTRTTALTEYGGRLIYRQSVLRSWFYLDSLLGYSWLRLNPGEPLQGTTSVGLGSEIWFGPGT